MFRIKLFVLILIGLFVQFFTATTFAVPPQPATSNVKADLMKAQPVKPIGFLAVTLPKNGDFWTIGEFQGVYWSYNAAAGKNVNIWLTKGNHPIQKITGNLNIENTVHHWQVPVSVVPGNDYGVMIESVENPAIKARSSGQFTIKKLQIEIKVMSPNTGLTWSRGTTQNIGWVYSGKPGTTVKITLEKSGAPVQVIIENYAIYQQIENFGNYVWNIPTNLTPGSDYKVKVQVTNTQYMDTSDQPFTIH